MFGSSSGGGGGGGNVKRGKGGGGASSRNAHQAAQELMHQVQPVPVMTQTQPMTIQPIFQTFHQPGMAPMYAPMIYLPTNPIHPAFSNMGAAPQTQYVFPRAQFASSVPVNLQTLGPFGTIPQNLTQNHTSPNQLTPLRSSHGPLAVAAVPTNTLHTTPSTTSTTLKKRRPNAIDIIDPETRKNIMEPWITSDDVKHEKAVEEKNKPSEDSANKVDCQMQTDVPVKVTKPVKSDEKDKSSLENGKYFSNF